MTASENTHGHFSNTMSLTKQKVVDQFPFGSNFYALLNFIGKRVCVFLVLLYFIQLNSIDLFIILIYFIIFIFQFCLE